MVDAFIMIAGVALGTVIWLWILRRYDKIEPEAVRHLAAVGLLGGLASVAVGALVNEAVRVWLDIDVAIFEQAHTVAAARLFVFCILIGFSEEIAKAVAAVTTTRLFGDLDEPIDAMIYAMTVGLGFAAFENVLYAVRFGNEVLLGRFLWPVPAHMAYAALWGYGLAKARFVYPERNVALVMAPSVIAAALLHATANFLLFQQHVFTAALSLFALAMLAVLAHRRLKELVAESPFLEPGECPTCRHVNDPKATHCAACQEALQDTEMFVTCTCGQARVAVADGRCPVCGRAVDGGRSEASVVATPVQPMGE